MFSFIADDHGSQLCVVSSRNHHRVASRPNTWRLQRSMKVWSRYGDHFCSILLFRSRPYRHQQPIFRVDSCHRSRNNSPGWVLLTSHGRNHPSSLRNIRSLRLAVNC